MGVRWTERSRGALEEAMRRGYVVNHDGSVTSPSGVKLKLYTRRQTRGFVQYYTFTLRNRIDGKVVHDKIKAHRLLALQKFGDVIFEDGIEVRHLNDNSLDNSWDNIVLGTHSENMLDQSKEKRRAITAHSHVVATAVRRLFTDDVEELIFRRHKDGSTYAELASKFGASRATISRILSKVRARLLVDG